MYFSVFRKLNSLFNVFLNFQTCIYLCKNLKSSHFDLYSEGLLFMTNLPWTKVQEKADCFRLPST